MGYFNCKLLDGYAVDQADDGYLFTTPWLDVKQAKAYAISVVFSGTATGTLILESSNESDIGSPSGFLTPATPPGLSQINTVNVLGPQPQFNGLDAKAIPGATASITTASTTEFDSGLLFTAMPGHRWVRVKYTGSAGTGTVSAWANVKF